MAIGYKITVSGTYRAVTERGKILKPFRNLEFILPEQTTYSPGRKQVTKKVNGHPVSTTVPLRATVNSLRIVKSLILGRFLPDRLKEEFDDYASVQRFDIVSQTRVKVDDKVVRDFTKVKVRDMTAPELNQFHALHDLNTVMSSYTDLSDRKMAVEREYKEKVAKQMAAMENKEELESLTEPEGVMISGPQIQKVAGRVTSKDGIPIDEQDPTAALLA